MTHFVVVNEDENHAILREQFLREREALEHELAPAGVAPGVVLVHEAVIIDEVAVPGVVGRVNADALHAPGEGHAQGAEGIEVVALDDEIAPAVCAVRRGRGERGVQLQGHEVRIQRAVALHFIGFPDEAEARGITPVPRLEEGEEFFSGKIVVGAGHG